MADERIIVAGCSGFVGRNTVKMLIQQGNHVVGFSRTNPNIEGLEHVPFDLTDDRNFNTTEYKESTIINAAALTTNAKNGHYKETNYESVLGLLSLNPKGRFIHISSSSIYDLSKDSVEVKEDEFQVSSYRFYNPYSEYKAQAEEALLHGVVERDIAPISLRPHAIYGKDDTTLIPALRKRVSGKTIVLPDRGKVMHSLTNIKNLLQAINLGLSYVPLQPEAFNVTDANPVLIHEAVTAALGDQVRVKGVPTKILLGSVGKILGVSQYEVRQLGMNRTYDLSKARALLGYEPTEFIVDWT